MRMRGGEAARPTHVKVHTNLNPRDRSISAGAIRRKISRHEKRGHQVNGCDCGGAGAQVTSQGRCACARNDG
jgi:hypothetical protein